MKNYKTVIYRHENDSQDSVIDSIDHNWNNKVKLISNNNDISKWK